MRSLSLVLLSAFGLLAAAQDILGSLPKCGQDCFGNNFAGCEQFDYACICGNKDLIAQLSCCVSTNCDAADESTIITLASGLCKAYGIDVPTQASCAASASSTPASTAASAASSGSSSASGSRSSSAASSITSAPSSTSASQDQSAAAQTNTASTTGSPGAAGPVATAKAGLGLAMGMAGLLVAL